MFAIPIVPQTLSLIAEISDNVAPTVEKEPTFFVWVADKPAQILDTEGLERYSDDWEIIKLGYLYDE
jgi:hypothetical protein